MEQTGLLDDLHQIRLHASSFRQLGGVIGNVLRMAEGVMILGINGGGQGVDGAGVLVVSALIFDPPDLAAVDLRGIHQDRVFTRVLHHTHGGIRIIEQLSGRGGHVRRRADAGADCQTAERAADAAIDLPNLCCYIFRQTFGGIDVVSGQNQRKFLAVYPGGPAVSANAGRQDVSHTLKGQVALLGPV